MFFGLHPADMAVILVYFAVVIGVGLWSARRVKSQEDYFLAGRKFGKLVQIVPVIGKEKNDSR